LAASPPRDNETDASGTNLGAQECSKPKAISYRHPQLYLDDNPVSGDFLRPESEDIPRRRLPAPAAMQDSVASTTSAPAIKSPAGQGIKSSSSPSSDSAKSNPEPGLAAVSSSPGVIHDPAEAEDELDEDARTRLRHRRLELNHEIGEFKERKEAQYRRFEATLRAEAKAKRKHDVDESKVQALGAQGSTEGHGGKEKGNNKEAGSLSPKGSSPLAGNHSKTTLREPWTPRSRDDILRDGTEKSPPFEKELQVAGLFAPCYLPLLEDRRTSPLHISTTPPQSPMPQAAAAHEQRQADLSNITPPQHHSPDSHPYPLESSLKSSSSSSLGTSVRKPKSPKKVTFQFEDENAVPSRSSPPPAKVIWNFGPVDDDDDDEYDEANEDDYEEVEEYIEDVIDPRDIGYGEEEGHEGTVEQVKVPSLPTKSGWQSVGERYHGDELVIPTMSSYFGVDHGEGGPISAVVTRPLKSPDQSGSPDQRDSNLPHNGTAQMKGDNKRSDADDDDGLFDLDETVPDEPNHTPPHRDLSPLLEAQRASQHLASPATNDLSLPPPSLAARVPLPQSFDPHITFGKSPVAAAFPNPTSSLSASFTHTPLRSSGRAPPPSPFQIASSLPASSVWGPPSTEDSTRFRRRSIIKYIPSPPPEEESDGSVHTKTPDGDKMHAPYATSLPMPIAPMLSTLRSPPSSTSPQTKPSLPDIPNTRPFSGRPSPATSPMAFRISESTKQLAASPPASRNSSGVDSYMKTARFPSASFAGGMMSPYRTRFAQELAERALQEGDNAEESFVGGVDGGTGLDPGSFTVRRGGTEFASPTTGIPVDGAWSLSARLAQEEGLATVGGSRR
jgi:hypothetical protein